MNSTRRRRTPLPISTPTRRRNYFPLAVCMVLLAVFLIHAPALKFQFVDDDHALTQRVATGSVATFFADSDWGIYNVGTAIFYRPVSLLWFKLNLMLWDLGSMGWHLDNLVLDLAVAALLGWMVWRLLRDRVLALLAAALFALHPAHAESYAWVSGAGDLLFAFWSLLTLMCVLTYQQSTALQPALSRQRRQDNKTMDWGPIALWASALFSMIALLAKETAMVLPVIVFAMGVLMLGQVTELDEKTEFAQRLKSGASVVLPILPSVVLYMLLRRAILGKWFPPAMQHLPISTELLSAPITLWFYVKVLFAPIIVRAFANPALVDSFSLHGFFLPLAGDLLVGGVLCGVSCWALRRASEFSAARQSGIRTAISLGGLLLVLPLLPAFHLNGLYAGDYLHGRYAYLPTSGLLLLLMAAASVLKQGKYIVWGLAGVLGCIFAMLTLQQLPMWSDDLTWATRAQQLAPHNQRMALRYGVELDLAGRCDEAITHLRSVVQEFPTDAIALGTLGDCLYQTHDLRGAEDAMKRAARLSRDPMIIQQLRAIQMELRGQPSTMPGNAPPPAGR